MMSLLTYITGFFYELWTFTDFDRLCKLEKRGDEIKKIFSSETTEPISTKLCWNDPKVVPFHNYVRERRPVSKIAAITKIEISSYGQNFSILSQKVPKIWTV